MFAFVFAAYIAVSLFYGYKSLTTGPSARNNKHRFSHSASGLILAASLVVAAMVIVPYESQTVQYINVNGTVNLYMLLVCYLFESQSESDYDYDQSDEMSEEESPNKLGHIELQTVQSLGDSL